MGITAVRHALSPYRPDRVAYRSAVKGRLCAERWALATRARAVAGRAPAKRGRILAYHSVGTPEWGVNDVSPSDFERHLQIAVDDGWSFATPAEVIAEPGKPQLALTFDDGLASVLTHAAPVLRHHHRESELGGEAREETPDRVEPAPGRAHHDELDVLRHEVFR